MAGCGKSSGASAPLKPLVPREFIACWTTAGNADADFVPVVLLTLVLFVVLELLVAFDPLVVGFDPVELAPLEFPTAFCAVLPEEPPLLVFAVFVVFVRLA